MGLHMGYVYDAKAERRVPDSLDKAGAENLARRIREYWRERGHEVQVDVQEKPFTSATRSIRYDVRSNLVNGMPAKKTPVDKYANRRSVAA